MTRNIKQSFWIPAFAGMLVWGGVAHAGKPDFCRYVEKHKLADSVTYKPGVDVDGKPVVPADLNSEVSGTYEDILIPIEINLIDRYNLTAPAGAELKPVVADMMIHKDGRVDYNGQDLTAQAVALCGEAAEKSAETGVETPKPEDGQGDADPVSSSKSMGKLIEGHSP